MAFPAIASALGSNSNAGIEGPMFIIQLIDQAIKRGQIPAKLAPWRRGLQTQEEQVGEIGRMRNEGLPAAYEANLRQLADAQGDAITRNLDSAAGVSPLGRSIAAASGTLARSRELGSIAGERAQNQARLTSDLFGAKTNRDSAAKELMNAELALKGQADAEVVSAVQGLGVGAQGVASALGGMSKSNATDKAVAGNASDGGQMPTSGYGGMMGGAGLGFGLTADLVAQQIAQQQANAAGTLGTPGTSGIGGGAIGGGLMGQYGTAPPINSLNSLPQGPYANTSPGMASLGPAEKVDFKLSGPQGEVQKILGSMQFGGINPNNEDAMAYSRAYGQNVGGTLGGALGRPIDAPGSFSVGPYYQQLPYSGSSGIYPGMGGLPLEFAEGGKVPEKPKAKPKAAAKTDTVPAMLTPGEVVVTPEDAKMEEEMAMQAEKESNSYRQDRMDAKLGAAVRARIVKYKGAVPQVA